jgi:hypothetical protein
VFEKSSFIILRVTILMPCTSSEIRNGRRNLTMMRIIPDKLHLLKADHCSCGNSAATIQELHPAAH